MKKDELVSFLKILRDRIGDIQEELKIVADKLGDDVLALSLYICRKSLGSLKTSISANLEVLGEARDELEEYPDEEFDELVEDLEDDPEFDELLEELSRDD